MEKEKLKTFSIVVFALFLCVCAVFPIWFLVVKIFAPEKVISTTMEVGDVTLKDGVSQPAIEVNFMKNENKNGFQMLEIKFTTLLDEKRTNFFQYGVQFIAKDRESQIQFNYIKDASKLYDSVILEGGGFFNSIIPGGRTVEANYGYLQPNANVFNYQSTDDFLHTTGATNPIDAQSMLKITLGEDIYGMRFKWDKIDVKDMAFVHHVEEKKNLLGAQRIERYLNYADMNLFAYKIFESLKSTPSGTNSGIVFEFADMFDWFECENEQSGRYSSTEIKSDLLTTEIKNYFQIKVKVSNSGAQKASDSLFGVVNGDSTFNLTGDYTSSDYLFGKEIIKADLFDFNLIKVVENTYALKLKSEFHDYYIAFKNEIMLSIEIDIDILKNLNFEFFGFAEDSGIKDFEIYECYKLETKMGQKERSEVQI